MAGELAQFLTETIERELPHLRAVDEERSRVPRAAGKWRPREELGHLIDSAANNHMRFVRGALEPEFHGPGYAQDEWVRVHGYGEMAWEAIVSLWFQYNQLLARVVERIPEERLETRGSIGGGPSITLGFVIDDYVLHMQHHIDQILRRETITPYPRAEGAAR
jgi:hypothetical protein